MNTYLFEYMAHATYEVLTKKVKANTLFDALQEYKFHPGAVVLLKVFENGNLIYETGHGLWY